MTSVIIFHDMFWPEIFRKTQKKFRAILSMYINCVKPVSEVTS